MPISALLHLECDPVEPIDAVKHSVFTCLQWRSSNLDLMPKADMLRFAVMYDEALENYVIKALEEAYLRGALSPVKLVAVRDDEIHLFLDSTVASSTIPAIKSLWVDVAEWPCLSYLSQLVVPGVKKLVGQTAVSLRVADLKGQDSHAETKPDPRS